MELLFITLPIFILIGLGFVLRLLYGITHAGIHALNSFVYWVSLPSVILVSFWGIDWFDQATREVLLINLAVVVGFAVALLLILTLLPCAKKTKAALFVSSLVGNTVYMGFPIGQRAFGEESYDLFLAAATPHLVVGIALSVLAIEWFVLRAHSPVRYLKDFVLNPLILALVAGITFSVLDLSGGWIELMKQPITMLAATASPIALVTLGAFLKGAFAWRLAGWALVASTLKLAVFPAVVLVAGLWFMIPNDQVSLSVIAAAMPCAVTAFVIAEKYDANPRLVASVLFLSTICSLVSITIWLALV